MTMSMSANDGSGSKRKRSRWGNKNAESPAPSHKSDNVSVSDDKAVEALLCSAQTNQQQKRPKQQVAQVARDTQPTTNRQKYAAQKDNRGSNQQTRQRERGRERPDDRDTSDRWGPGPSTNDTGRESNDEEAEDGTNNTDNGTTSPKKAPQKPNFGLSGALAQDDGTGNIYNGVLLKFTEPPEARTPNTRWRLYVFKKNTAQRPPAASKARTAEGDGDDGDLVDVMHVSKQSAYLFGRDRKVADIPADHPSLSKQHCVLQFRALPDGKDALRGQHQRHKLRCKPYIIDLESTNGTFVNGVKLEQARYYELRKGDVITLGFSSREYVLLTENTTSA